MAFIAEGRVRALEMNSDHVVEPAARLATRNVIDRGVEIRSNISKSCCDWLSNRWPSSRATTNGRPGAVFSITSVALAKANPRLLGSTSCGLLASAARN